MSRHIKQIQISDFRGFEGEKTLDLEGADLVIFLGLNGFGKTSIFDAVEWGLTGKLGRYEAISNAPGRRQDFQKEKEILRNKYATSPNTFVKLTLSDNKKIGRRVVGKVGASDYSSGTAINGYEFGLNSICEGTLPDEFINNFFSATHLLSQETIHHFVTSTKPEDRYNALSVNFGTAIFNPFEDNIQKLITAIEGNEKQVEADLKSHTTFLQEMQKTEAVGIEQIVTLLGTYKDIAKQFNKIVISDQFPDLLLKEKNEVENLKEAQRFAKLHLRSIEKNEELDEAKLKKIEFLIEEYEDYQESAKNLEKSEKEIREAKKSLLITQELIKTREKLKNESFILVDQVAKAQTRKNRVDFVNSLIEEFSSNLVIIKEKEEAVARNADLIEQKVLKLPELSTRIIEGNALFASHESNIRKHEFLLESLGKNEELLNSYVEENKKFGTARDLNLLQLKELEKKGVQLDGIADLLAKSGQDTIVRMKKILEMITPLSILDKELVKKWVSFLSQYENLRKEIHGNEIQIKSAKEELEKVKASFTLKKRVLADSLAIIDKNNQNCDCPVCKTSFISKDLVAIIEQEIGQSESMRIHELSKCLLNLENEKKKYLEADAKNAGALQGFSDYLMKVITDKNEELFSQMEDTREYLGNLIQFNTSQTDSYNEIMERLKLVQADSFEDYADTFATVKGKIAELKIVSQGHSDDLEEKRRELGFAQAEIDQLKELNANLAEDINRLKDEKYKEVTNFLIENAIDIAADKNGFRKITKIVEAHEKDLKKATEENETLNISILENKKQIDEIPKEKNEASLLRLIQKLQNEIQKDEEYIAEIHEDLGALSLTAVEYKKTNLNKLKVATEKKVETYENQRELLLEIDEHLENFKDFNESKGTRKKIEQYTEKISAFDVSLTLLDKIKKEAVALRKEVPTTLKSMLIENLDVDLFNTIYGALSPHRRFQKIDFDIEVSRSKIGIHFDAKQSKISARPEFLFSSAQLNTFGICMFLSMALRQNWLKLDSILIDDPIQNLDDINILSFIDFIRGLIDSKKRKQIILSTHDERFYDLILRKFVGYKVKAFRFESYGRINPDPMATF